MESESALNKLSEIRTILKSIKIGIDTYLPSILTELRKMNSTMK